MVLVANFFEKSSSSVPFIVACRASTSMFFFFNQHVGRRPGPGSGVTVIVCWGVAATSTGLQHNGSMHASAKLQIVHLCMMLLRYSLRSRKK